MVKKVYKSDGIYSEVMIAMLILSTSLLVLLNRRQAIDGNDWSDNTTAVTQLMQQKPKNDPPEY